MFLYVFSPLFLGLLGFLGAIAIPGTTFILSLFGLLCFKAWCEGNKREALKMAPHILVTAAVSLVSLLMLIVEIIN